MILSNTPSLAQEQEEEGEEGGDKTEISPDTFYGEDFAPGLRVNNTTINTTTTTTTPTASSKKATAKAKGRRRSSLGITWGKARRKSGMDRRDRGGERVLELPPRSVPVSREGSMESTIVVREPGVDRMVGEQVLRESAEREVVHLDGVEEQGEEEERSSLVEGAAVEHVSEGPGPQESFLQRRAREEIEEEEEEEGNEEDTSVSVAGGHVSEVWAEVVAPQESFLQRRTREAEEVVEDSESERERAREWERERETRVRIRIPEESLLQRRVWDELDQVAEDDEVEEEDCREQYTPQESTESSYLEHDAAVVPERIRIAYTSTSAMTLPLSTFYSSAQTQTTPRSSHSPSTPRFDSSSRHRPDAKPTTASTSTSTTSPSSTQPHPGPLTPMTSSHWSTPHHATLTHHLLLHLPHPTKQSLRYKAYRDILAKRYKIFTEGVEHENSPEYLNSLFGARGREWRDDAVFGLTREEEVAVSEFVNVRRKREGEDWEGAMQVVRERVVGWGVRRWGRRVEGGEGTKGWEKRVESGKQKVGRRVRGG